MKECPKNPDEKHDRAEDFDSNDLGVPKKTVKVERLLAPWSNVEGRVWHTISYLPAIEGCGAPASMA
jgi:hypothetical protein